MARCYRNRQVEENGHVAVRPEIRLRTLKDGKERTMNLERLVGYLFTVDWSADSKSLWVSASTSDEVLRMDLQMSI